MSYFEAHELVGAFAEMLVDVSDPAELWPRMLQHLQDAVGFDAGYIGATWGAAAEGRGAVLEHDEPSLKSSLGRLLAELAPGEVAAYTERARNHDEVWTPARMKELAIFNEVLLPSGMRHMLVRVSVRHGNVAGFNLERRGISPRFSEDDARVVDTVAPFLHIVELLTLDAGEDPVTQTFAEANQLSKREAEFLNLLVRGLQNAEIAIVARVSVNTVRNTLARMFEKLEVTTRAELTFIATHYDSEPRGRRIRRPGSGVTPRLPDDGLLTFRSHVEEAALAKALPPPRPKPPRPPSPIIYTAPLLRLPHGS